MEVIKILPTIEHSITHMRSNQIRVVKFSTFPETVFCRFPFAWNTWHYLSW